jgi:Ankyrin repeat
MVVAFGYDDDEDDQTPHWAVDLEGDFPLHWAVACGDVETVKRLLDAGADARERAWLPTNDDLQPHEPMDVLGGVHWRFFAPRTNPAAMIACVRLLSAAGGTIDTDLDSLCTMIDEVFFHLHPNEYVAVARVMIETQGFDAVARGGNALYVALDRHMPDVAFLLLRAGVSPDTRAFTHAVRCHPLVTVVHFLDHGANPYLFDAIRCIRETIRDSAGKFYFQEREDAKNAAKLKFIEDLWECRRAFDRVKDALHRELIERVFHPDRLARAGYFDTNDLADF